MLASQLGGFLKPGFYVRRKYHEHKRNVDQNALRLRLSRGACTYGTFKHPSAWRKNANRPALMLILMLASYV